MTDSLLRSVVVVLYEPQDPVNIAAVQDGKFTFVIGISQGSLDIADITTSYSPPGCPGCP